MIHVAMTMSRFFESLGAPLKNVRWSWGSQRQQDKTVFLRAWNDDLESDTDGRKWVMILNRFDPAKPPKNFGWHERVEHIKQI